MPSATKDTPRSKITRLRDSGKKWREIGDVYPGVKLGTLARIYFDPGYEPRKPELRAALGLPCYAPAPVCPHCGNVPLAKRCPCKRKPRTAPRRNWKKAYTWAASMVLFMSRTE